MCSDHSSKQCAEKSAPKRRRKYRRRADSLIFKLFIWPILCDDKTEIWDGIACLPERPLSRTRFVVVDRLFNSDRDGVGQWMKEVWEREGTYRTSQIYLTTPPNERSGVDIIGVGEKYEDQRWGAHTKSATTEETDCGEIRTDVWPW